MEERKRWYGSRAVLVASIAWAATSWAGNASAGPLVDISSSLTNASFEANTNTISSPQSPLVCPGGGWTCPEANSTPGAAAFKVTSAQYTPGADGLPNNLVVPNGSNAALLPAHLSGLPAGSDPLSGAGTGSLMQTTSLTYTNGTSYFLDFWIGLPKTQPDGTTAVTSLPGTIQLILLGAGNLCDQGTATLSTVSGATKTVVQTVHNGTTCVLTNFTVASGMWQEYELNFSDIGVNTGVNGVGNLGIEFFVSASSAGQPHEMDLDIGALSSPPTPLRVPEPASLALLGAGLGALGLIGRRRRAAR